MGQTVGKCQIGHGARNEGSQRLTSTSSSAEKLARAEQLGADQTINYEETADVAERVRDITRGRGVDIVIDTVGAAEESTRGNE